jgi:cellulose synthase/poly-beta-1,6-N-acetylglucosamine synthase-like glycosyltransferase
MICLWVLPLAYAILMTCYYLGWQRIAVYESPIIAPRSSVTVIIAARNEAAYIQACIQSILDNQYPAHLLEILVVNDHSEDETVGLVEAMAAQSTVVRLLHLADFMDATTPVKGYKKKAIESAVGLAKGSLIITTDADCEVSKNWIQTLVSVFETQENIQLVTGPVLFYREKSLFECFQSLDFLGLMGITGAGIQGGWQRMGNGANLAYRKSVFTALNGYDGNTHIASGDDMFLIQKVAQQYPNSIFFLKSLEAIVFTEAKPDLSSFISQRLRWGTKNAALPEWPIRLALLLVFVFCCAIMVLGAAAIFWPTAAAYFLGFCLLKMLFDFIFLRTMAQFFRRSDLMRSFFMAFWLHTAYIALLGLGSLFGGRYTWKKR